MSIFTLGFSNALGGKCIYFPFSVQKLTPEEQMKYLKQKPSVSTLKFTNVFKVGFLKLMFQLALQKLRFLDGKKKQVYDREELHLSQPSVSYMNKTHTFNPVKK